MKKKNRAAKRKRRSKLKYSAPNKNRADNFYNRGILAEREGDVDRAIECYRKTLQYHSDDADAHYNLGVALSRQGRYADARVHFVKTVTLKSKDATAWNNLGVTARKLGDRDEARNCYATAVSLDPSYATAHKNMGALCIDEGEYRQARMHFEASLEIEPGNPEIHLMLGNLFEMTGPDEQARHHYLKSIACDPQSGPSHFGLGRLFLRQNRIGDALDAFRSAVQTDPRQKRYWQAWAKTLNRTTGMPSYPQFEDDLSNCLLVEGIDKSFLSIIVPRYLRGRPKIRDLINMAEQADKTVLRAKIISGELFDILNRPLLIHFLENVIATDRRLELFLTAVRRQLLILSSAGEIPQDIEKRGLRFITSLAHQCFLNEYVYFATPEEDHTVERSVQDVVSGMDRSEIVPAFRIALSASYTPLFKTPLHTYADSMSNASDALARLVDLQIREPLLERALKAEIPSLSTIGAGLSSNVRSQYENNPYPRWKDAGFITPESLESRIKGMFRQFSGDIAKAPKVLVAGCGTGRQAVNCAQRYLDAHVTAFDLSLSSLSYGKRKAREMGIANIDFFHGDILRLNGDQRAYDVIECSGVLHHMDDPVKGWKILLEHLKPGGLMKIGLYSRTARKGIEILQAFIDRKAYEASSTGIRAFRYDVLKGKDHTLGDTVKNTRDFYSLSACRDLFFHVKEHCYTLPQLKSILASLSLAFLGFESSKDHLISTYKEIFPEDDHCSNLDNWHLFEQMYPYTFDGMYQFWVQKR